MAVAALMTVRATGRMVEVMARVVVMATVEADRNMAVAAVIALFREAVVKAGKGTDAAGTMIKAAAIALFREAAVKDMDVERIMADAEKATDPVRSTAMVTPVDLIINEVERDTDAVDRTMVKTVRAIAAVATSNRVSVIPANTAAVMTLS